MERSYLEWIYIGPVLLLLGTNTFFLISIFYVVVTKLRSTGQYSNFATIHY
jgi:7 transmembrane receptor (Secretin family)